MFCETQVYLCHINQCLRLSSPSILVCQKKNDYTETTSRNCLVLEWILHNWHFKTTFYIQINFPKLRCTLYFKKYLWLKKNWKEGNCNNNKQKWSTRNGLHAHPQIRRTGLQHKDTSPHVLTEWPLHCATEYPWWSCMSQSTWAVRAGEPWTLYQVWCSLSQTLTLKAALHHVQVLFVPGFLPP